MVLTRPVLSQDSTKTLPVSRNAAHASNEHDGRRGAKMQRAEHLVRQLRTVRKDVSLVERDAVEKCSVFEHLESNTVNSLRTIVLELHWMRG